jgi:putative transposase
LPDNVPEMTSGLLSGWLKKKGARALCIELESPRGRGYDENFNGKLHDKCLNGQIFYKLKEA